MGTQSAASPTSSSGAETARRGKRRTAWPARRSLSGRSMRLRACASACPALNKSGSDWRRPLPKLKVHALLCALVPGASHAAIEVTDETGQKVRLEKPATRIVSFAPHVTELLFAVGA